MPVSAKATCFAIWRWCCRCRNPEGSHALPLHQEKQQWPNADKLVGSNLFLDGKKARGSWMKPRSFIAQNRFLGEVVPASGIEPLTLGL